MNTPKELTEAEQIARGEQIAQVFHLKTVRGYTPTRYATDWGTKTARGVYLTARRLVDETPA